MSAQTRLRLVSNVTLRKFCKSWKYTSRIGCACHSDAICCRQLFSYSTSDHHPTCTHSSCHPSDEILVPSDEVPCRIAKLSRCSPC